MCDDSNAHTGGTDMKETQIKSEDLKAYLKEGIDSGRIKEGGFVEEAINLHVELLEEDEKEKSE